MKNATMIGKVVFTPILLTHVREKSLMKLMLSFAFECDVGLLTLHLVVEIAGAVNDEGEKPYEESIQVSTFSQKKW
jgi:hypothetical protein